MFEDDVRFRAYRLVYSGCLAPPLFEVFFSWPRSSDLTGMAGWCTVIGVINGLSGVVIAVHGMLDVGSGLTIRKRGIFKPPDSF